MAKEGGDARAILAAHSRTRALNPALGLRAIRLSLADPGTFLMQLRAIMRAAVHGPVNLLIPMLAHASEILGDIRRWKSLNKVSISTPVNVTLSFAAGPPRATTLCATTMSSFEVASLE